MKNSFCLIVIFLSLGFCAGAQEVQVTSKKEQKIKKKKKDISEEGGKIEEEINEKEDGPTVKLSPKKQQSEKLKERIEIVRSKLEKERLGGELPGGYIAAQEAKIAKMELKLEKMMNVSKTPGSKKKQKSNNKSISKDKKAAMKAKTNDPVEVIENEENKG